MMRSMVALMFILALSCSSEPKNSIGNDENALCPWGAVWHAETRLGSLSLSDGHSDHRAVVNLNMPGMTTLPEPTTQLWHTNYATYPYTKVARIEYRTHLGVFPYQDTGTWTEYSTISTTISNSSQESYTTECQRYTTDNVGPIFHDGTVDLYDNGNNPYIYEWRVRYTIDRYTQGISPVWIYNPNPIGWVLQIAEDDSPLELCTGYPLCHWTRTTGIDRALARLRVESLTPYLTGLVYPFDASFTFYTQSIRCPGMSWGTLTLTFDDPTDLDYELCGSYPNFYACNYNSEFVDGSAGLHIGCLYCNTQSPLSVGLAVENVDLLESDWTLMECHYQ